MSATNRARPGTGLGLRVVLTVGLLGLYYLARFLRLPGLDPLAALELSSAMQATGELTALAASALRSSVIGLGVQPFLTSFLVVEIAALLLPAGRRLRAGGVTGRGKLNALAAGLGVIFATVQAGAFAVFLQSQTSPTGAALVPTPGAGFRVVAVLTLVAGSTACFGLAQAISRFGLGNGLGWLLGLTAIRPLVHGISNQLSGREPEAPWLGLELLLLLAAGAATVFLLRRGRERRRVTRQGGDFALVLPAFPQSVIPVQWGQSMAGMFWMFLGGGGLFGALLPRWLSLEQPLARHLCVVITVLAVPVLSVAFYRLFSGRARLASALGGDAEATPGLAALLTSKATLALTGFTLGFTLLAWYPEVSLLSGLTYIEVVLLVALVTDLVAEWRFRSERTGGTVRLLELDNVHLASCLEGELAAASVAALARGYHFRSLFFLFQPAIKIDLLVAEADLPRALEIVQPERLEKV